MVRLKGFKDNGLYYHFETFNSYMVRLKEIRGAQADNQALFFQFLYGTIKSPRAYLKISEVKSFQFLYGTIKSKATL